MTEEKEKRGGKRKGSGRKKVDLSEKELQSLLKEFKQLAKETGKSIARLLGEIAYGIEKSYATTMAGEVVEVPMPVRVKLKAIELYYQAALVKRTQTTIDDKRSGPTIGLPPTIPVPKQKQEEQPQRLHG